ncbi:predicted protein [Nematostella vectensis]|uniref:Sel1 repeat family protein n=1 Tax=Nematostella vectensis TaxID=45351 RepID=A7TAS1_NEMVE|nr:predicted protein [Nematostella vectensis]|eukprot:XP_001619000.1 hypothetical protein NEMVEDRAFT_v1g224613 [Nematostella vectensis]
MIRRYGATPATKRNVSVSHHALPSTLLLSFLPLFCQAQPAAFHPKGEALYQQAAPYLNEARAKLDAVPADTPRANTEVKKQAMVLIEAAGQQLKVALPLLEQASALGHPVAQYRLALIYEYELNNAETEPKVCPLLLQSVGQGFAPSALMVDVYCPEFAASADFLSALASVEANQERYAHYYPQPVVMLECQQQKMPTGMAMLNGDGQDFQAEIYRLQGDHNRAQRNEFYQKAVDLNGCPKAERRLKRS